MKSKKNRITDEEIEKAFDELAEEADLVKAEDEELEEEELDEEESEEEDEEEELDEEDEEEEEDVEEGIEDDFDDEDDDNEEEVQTKRVAKSIDPNIKKGIEVSPFLKAVVSDIEKANTETRKVLANVATIVKGLTERIEDLEDTLDKTPRKPKSVIRKSEIANRFEKANDSDEEEDGVKSLGLRKDYRKILNTLDELSGINNNDGKVDVGFAKAMSTLEATRTLPADIIGRLKKEHQISIDPTM